MLRIHLLLVRCAVPVFTLFLLGAAQPASAQFGKRLEAAMQGEAENKAIDAATGAAPAGGTGEPKRWLNYDFVPGDRVISYTDYSEDEVGNFPQRLDLQSGNMEVAELGGQRYLRVSNQSVFSIPLPEVLLEEFTVEIEVISRKSGDGAAFHLNGGPKPGLHRESTIVGRTSCPAAAGRTAHRLSPGRS